MGNFLPTLLLYTRLLFRGSAARSKPPPFPLKSTREARGLTILTREEATSSLCRALLRFEGGPGRLFQEAACDLMTHSLNVNAVTGPRRGGCPSSAILVWREVQTLDWLAASISVCLILAREDLLIDARQTSCTVSEPWRASPGPAKRRSPETRKSVTARSFRLGPTLGSVLRGCSSCGSG